MDRHHIAIGLQQPWSIQNPNRSLCIWPHSHCFHDKAQASHPLQSIVAAVHLVPALFAVRYRMVPASPVDRRRRPPCSRPFRRPLPNWPIQSVARAAEGTKGGDRSQDQLGNSQRGPPRSKKRGENSFSSRPAATS